MGNNILSELKKVFFGKNTTLTGTSDEKDSLMDFKQYQKRRMSSFRDRYKGKRCFVIGNGPSLNKTDLSLLKDDFSFGVNGIFYKHDEMGFTPTFYVVEDNHVIADNLETINNIDYSLKFFPHDYDAIVHHDDKTTFFNADMGFYKSAGPHYHKPRFSKDCSDVVFAGQTVTYMNLQLAYYFGFRDVYLIGMDFSYSVPKSTIVEGVNFTSGEDDPNHFHPDYFGKGKKWHDPQLENCKLVYEFAKRIYEEDGRRIYNATLGGKLEVFERVDYHKLF